MPRLVTGNDATVCIKPPQKKTNHMFKKFFIALIVSVVAVVGIGFFLPGDFDVKRTIVIDGKPADIYPVVADLKQWPEWTVWNDTTYPGMEITYGEVTSGLGAEYSWKGEASGNGTMKITKAEEPGTLEWELNFDGFETSYGYCTIKAVERDRTRVDFGMRGNMGASPINKYFGLMMDSMMGSEFDKNLKNLKDRVENPPAAEKTSDTEKEPKDGADKTTDEKPQDGDSDK